MMDYIRYILPLLAVAAIGLGGCTEAEDAPVLPEIDAVELAATELCIGGQGGDVVLRFNANRDWTITYVDDRTATYGLLQTREGGAGTGCEAIYTAFPNTGKAARDVTFRISAGRASAEITVRQDALGIELPSEDEVKAYLMRLYNETDGPNWRFKCKWRSDLPLNQWGTEVKYENGLLELNLAEHYLKGKVNLSGCRALVRIRAAKNAITEVDLSDCPMLKSADFTNNGLQSIDVSGCLSLTRLNVSYNLLSYLDIGWSTTLSELRCEYNAIEDMDLSRCVSLQDLACHNNRLKRLEIPHRQRLDGLWCYANEIRTLDVSNAPRLWMFNCSENELESLDVSGCPLRVLWCYSNHIKEIDLSASRKHLSELYCSSNELGTLDFRDFDMLGWVQCSDNNLTYLDIRGCRNLTRLYCSYNRLESLDFDGVNVKLLFSELDCSYNRMKRADLTSLLFLKKLWCQGNRLGGEIPEWMDNLTVFEHDARYEYLPSGTSSNYTDRGYGWWYPGEPHSGHHSR